MRSGSVVMGVSFALLLATSACRPQTEPQALFGEVHVHQFLASSGGGGHAEASFVAEPVPAADVHGDTVVELASRPAASEGRCTLTLPSSCVAPCEISPTWRSDGRVHVEGAQGGPVVLAYDETTRAYDAEGQTPIELVRGGERLQVRGEGSADLPAFAGEVPVPLALQPALPDAAQVARGQAWPGYAAGGADRIDVALSASTDAGQWALIECVLPDDGAPIALPPSLLAELPPPPRTLSLQVSRDVLRNAPSEKAGLGVLLHVGFVLLEQMHEP